MKYYYVTKKNSKTGSKELMGFNLTEAQKDEAFYSYKTPSGGKTSQSYDEEGVSNSYGCHKVEFKNEKQAIKELITKPNELNDALKVLDKNGLIAVEKVSKIFSYQQLRDDIF